jgi:hypothetical protein
MIIDLGDWIEALVTGGNALCDVFRFGLNGDCRYFPAHSPVLADDDDEEEEEEEEEFDGFG